MSSSGGFRLYSFFVFKIKPKIRVLLYTYIFDRAFGIFSSFCFSTAAAAAAAGGAASFCLLPSGLIRHFLFNFPFDEIYYRRILFFHSRAFCFRVNRLHN